jgi:hypothetical protein
MEGNEVVGLLDRVGNGKQQMKEYGRSQFIAYLTDLQGYLLYARCTRSLEKGRMLQANTLLAVGAYTRSPISASTQSCRNRACQKDRQCSHDDHHVQVQGVSYHVKLLR